MNAKSIQSPEKRGSGGQSKKPNVLDFKPPLEFKKPALVEKKKSQYTERTKSVLPESKHVKAIERRKSTDETECKNKQDSKICIADDELFNKRRKTSIVSEHSDPTSMTSSHKFSISDGFSVSTKPSNLTIVQGLKFDRQFGDVMINIKPKSKIQRICCYFRPQPPPLTPKEFQSKIQELHGYCLVHIQDSYKVHINRLKGIELLDEIISRTDFDRITNIQEMSLLWCALSCLHHFYIRLDVSKGIMAWIRRNQARRAMRTYEKLIYLSMPNLFNIVVRAIITFYSESKMWHTEYLCAELLKRLLYISHQSETAVHAILDIAEKISITNMREAQQVIRVLYQVLENYPWSDMDDYLMMRFLVMYKRSIMPSNDNIDYVPLQKGLEVCLRHIIENLPNSHLLKIIQTMIQWTFTEQLSDEAVLDFGNILEYAAMRHVTYLFRDSLYHDLFPQLMQLVASDNRLHSLLGNHVFQHLIDRHSNRGYFDTPKIFFDDVRTEIVVSQYNSEDKQFMRKYREVIHTALLASIQLHGVHRINLESTYASIALLVVEIPCGYTAAAIVCLAMAIQEYALSDENLELQCTHRLHATVMGIMSLVCFVHNAQVFYDYLRTVMARRAQYAPYLNPPLKATYEYAQHHILWNKPDLFFEDWEARYGLWKCFRTRRTRISTSARQVKSEIEI